MTEDRNFSARQISSHALAVRSQMKDMTAPFLKKIEKMKINFHQKKQHHAALSKQTITIEQQSSSCPIQSKDSFSSRDHIERNTEVPRVITQSSCDEQMESGNKQLCYEWTNGQASEGRFTKMEQIIEHYNRVFQQKIKFSKGYKYGGESFKAEEKQIIQQIYQDIADHSDHTVTFEAVHQFFKKCSLFFRIYNIHPDSLQDVLSDSAHHYENRLTEEEFMNFFLLNNRTNEDYEIYNIDKIQKKCVLDEESWKDLKDIFDIFDTFGNETIEVNKFFRKLTINHQYKQLLKKDVIYFPNINRYYPLQKIIFGLENKLKISFSVCQWGEIKSLIQHFSHIREPTFDVIVKEQISNGIITQMSNNFMLNTKILTQMKQIFTRCPKYCTNFVKISQFCEEVYEYFDNKPAMQEVVKKEPNIVTFKGTLITLMNQSHKFMDLDQILEWFSIKGNTSNQDSENKEKGQEIEVSSSDDEQFSKERRNKDKEKKNIQNLPKKYAKSDQRHEVTQIKQFKLTKKGKSTIRQHKIKQMVEQQKAKQMQQCLKPFKAHAIPASINNEKYEEYKASLDIYKESIKSKLNAKKQKQKITLQYLQSNTKLFEKPKKVQAESVEFQYFKAEPAPWFVHLDMLDQINAEKKKKLKLLKKETSLKYLKDWKNLPAFLYDPDYGSSHQTSQQGSNKYVGTVLNINDDVYESQITSKVKQIPDFKALHQQYQEELQKNKKHYKPTVIKEFQLSSPRVKPVSMSNPTKRPESARAHKQNINNSGQKPNYIGSTLKYQSMVKHTKEKKQLGELQRQEEIKDERQKKYNKEMFAKLVQRQLKKQMKKSLKSTGSSMKSKKNPREIKQNEIQLAAMYQRVFTRPFLFQEISSKKQNNHELEKGKIVKLRAEKPFNFENPTKKQFPGDQINFSGDVLESVQESSIISRKSA